MKSIRYSMIAYVLAGGGLLLVLGAIILNARIGRVLDAQFDAALISKAGVLATLVGVAPEEPAGVDFHFGDEFMPEFEASIGTEYFQLRFDDGRLLENSNRMGDADFGYQQGPDTDHIVRDVVLPDGRAGRAVEFDFIPQNDGEDYGPWISDSDHEVVAGISSEAQDFVERFPEAGMTLVYARSREELDLDLALVRWTTVGVNVAILLGLALVLVRAGHMVTQPIEQICHELGAIDPGVIQSRVDVAPCPREIEPLALQLNAMLDRFQQGLVREKRFSSDVAHELRSPVTRLRLMAEVGSMDPNLSAEQAEMFADLDDAARKLESIVNGLLLIARAESGSAQENREPTDVQAALDEVVRDARFGSEGQAVSVAIEGERTCLWLLDTGYFAIAMRNLVDNAFAHGCDPHAVRVTFGERDGSGWVAVTNPADSLNAAELSHLFDRFWRQDASRPADGHIGLGLSIVRAVSELMGWHARASMPESGVLRITLDGIQLLPKLDALE